ncbi:MAG: hypothetical protein C0510_07605 [Erythrobacter sp.]|nr:hypothetical protein [Erythrobacter sp.]
MAWVISDLIPNILQCSHCYSKMRRPLVPFFRPGMSELAPQIETTKSVSQSFEIITLIVRHITLFRLPQHHLSLTRWSQDNLSLWRVDVSKILLRTM